MIRFAPLTLELKMHTLAIVSPTAINKCAVPNTARTTSLACLVFNIDATTKAFPLSPIAESTASLKTATADTSCVFVEFSKHNSTAVLSSRTRHKLATNELDTLTATSLGVSPVKAESTTTRTAHNLRKVTLGEQNAIG